MRLQNHVDGMTEHGRGNAAPKRLTKGLLDSRSIARSIVPFNCCRTDAAAPMLLLMLLQVMQGMSLRATIGRIE